MNSDRPFAAGSGPIEPKTGPVVPNLQDYEAQRRNFSWERLHADLVERADGRMNIAMLAIDQPATHTPAKVAARFVDAGYGDPRSDVC